MSITILIQLLINGMLLGAFYATMALGFSTIWGVMRLINLAHGEFLIMAAFVAWFFFNPTREQSFSLAIPIQDSLNEVQLMYFQMDLSMMFLVMVWLGLSIGFMISHIILASWLRLLAQTARRTIGYGVGTVTAIVFYFVWRGFGFPSIDPFLILPVIFILFFALGYIVQKGFFNRLVEGPYLTMLLITFSVAIILQYLGLNIYAADPRRINIEYGNAIRLGEVVTISPTKLLTMLVSIGMIIGLTAFLRYTRVGYAIRAASQNKMAARLMGINIQEVYAVTFAISLGLTAMAGAMMATFQPVSPVNGPVWTLRAFAIVALGGLGKVQGVVVGGLVLGLAESLIGGYIGIGWAIAAAFVLLVVMLVIRPQGITGGLVPAEE